MDPPHANLGAALWALDPQQLNETCFGKWGLPGIGTPQIRPLWADVFKDEKVDSGKVAAFRVKVIDVRMLVQQAAFTLHGTSRGIETLERAETFVRRFRIPAEAKPVIQMELYDMGITRKFLFPDLENLAGGLQDEINLEQAWSPPAAGAPSVPAGPAGVP